MFDWIYHGFGALCGQNPAHTWAPGGIPLPCCQRCAGLYAGACLAALLHLSLRLKLTGRFLEAHGLFLALMLPFGLHWLPQAPALRAASGLLFGFAVVTFLWLPLAQRRSRRTGILPVTVSWRSGRYQPGVESRLQPGRGHAGCLSYDVTRTPVYVLALVFALILLPLAGEFGGRLAACALSGIVFAGALALAVLAFANVVLAGESAIRCCRGAPSRRCSERAPAR
jgi:uncharacterized membrane protein